MKKTNLSDSAEMILLVLALEVGQKNVNHGSRAESPNGEIPVVESRNRRRLVIQEHHRCIDGVGGGLSANQLNNWRGAQEVKHEKRNCKPQQPRAGRLFRIGRNSWRVGVHNRRMPQRWRRINAACPHPGAISISLLTSSLTEEEDD
jgi:hypothetical protein